MVDRYENSDFSKIDGSHMWASASVCVRRPAVLVSTLIVLVTSCIVIAFGGGLERISLSVVVGGVATGAHGSVMWPSAVAIVIGLLGTAVVGSMIRRRAWKEDLKDNSSWAPATHPLIFDIASSYPNEDTTKASSAEDAENNSKTNEREEVGSQALQKPRDPFKGHRQRLLAAARKRTASWVALLIRGFDVRADGNTVSIQLQGPSWRRLAVGSESLSLVSIAFRLEGNELRLVTEEAAGERVITLELEDDSWALELALALKTLRAEADTGGGVCAWGERPADELKRPPPVE